MSTLLLCSGIARKPELISIRQKANEMKQRLKKHLCIVRAFIKLEGYET